ncbi:MAG: sulfite exporter TauE/SafE family protein [Holophaga sp.]|nr:sulfite exporter TauE/SafE family protein [Holophaga sp.]
MQASTILIAAFAAGAINSIAGGGTLVSFPALLGVGLTGQQANVTSTLALWPGSIGGFYGHRKDLAGTRAFALRLVPPSILGAAVGAVLMLVTPNTMFDRLIPYLILTATLLMAANEPISKLIQGTQGGQRTTTWWIGAITFQFLVGVYGGYFGAGIGILMLAALSLLGLKDIHQMNGLKNFLALSINGVAIIAFIVYEHLFHPGYIVWWMVLMMVVTSCLGGLFGSHMAHRVGRKTVRVIVIGVGFVLAGWYFYKMHGL